MNRAAHGARFTVLERRRKQCRPARRLSLAQIGKQFLCRRVCLHCRRRIFFRRRLPPAQVCHLCRKFRFVLSRLELLFGVFKFGGRVAKYLLTFFERGQRFVATRLELFALLQFRLRRLQFLTFGLQVLQGGFLFAQFVHPTIQFFAPRFFRPSFIEFNLRGVRFSSQLAEDFLSRRQRPRFDFQVLEQFGEVIGVGELSLRLQRPRLQ